MKMGSIRAELRVKLGAEWVKTGHVSGMCPALPHAHSNRLWLHELRARELAAGGLRGKRSELAG